MAASAIVGVCYDQRQRRILDLALPSWLAFGRRHGIPVHIIDRSFTGPHFYWNKHVLFRIPELQRYDCLLFLDNDVLINDEAPSLLNNPSPDQIGATLESTQAGWSPHAIHQYYASYGVRLDGPAPDSLGIINTGVLVIPRTMAAFLEKVFEDWKNDLPSLPQRADRGTAPFALEADQPHVSYAMQKAGCYTDIGERFNTLWWDWYRKNVSDDRRPFLLRSKTASLLWSKIPRRLWRTLFAREIALFQKARRESYFLHVAGSKSAIFLSTPSSQ